MRRPRLAAALIAGAIFPRTLLAAPPPRPAMTIDRLVLDHGLRIILARMPDAPSVGIALAIEGGLSIEDGTHAGWSLAVLGEHAMRGDLAPAVRSALLTRRGLSENVEIGGRAAFHTWNAPPDELPLALYLTGQSLREPRWDDASARLAEIAAATVSSPWDAARRAFFSDHGQGRSPASSAGLSIWDQRLRSSPAALAVVGDVDGDRVAEWVHRYLDGGASRGPSVPVADAASLDPAPPVLGRAFAVVLAARISGTADKRRGLRAAFDAFVETRLVGATPKSARALAAVKTSMLTVNRLDEPGNGGDLVAVRVTFSDADGLARAAAQLRAELAAFLNEGPSAGELAAAYARQDTRDDLTSADPQALAARLACGELEGDPRASLLRRRPLLREAIVPLLRPAFGGTDLRWLEERPRP